MNTQQITEIINSKLNEFKNSLTSETNINKQAFYRSKISALEIALNHVVEGVEPEILKDLEYKEPEKIK